MIIITVLYIMNKIFYLKDLKRGKLSKQLIINFVYLWKLFEIAVITSTSKCNTLRISIRRTNCHTYGNSSYIRNFIVLIHNKLIPCWKTVIIRNTWWGALGLYTLRSPLIYTLEMSVYKRAHENNIIRLNHKFCTQPYQELTSAMKRCKWASNSVYFWIHLLTNDLFCEFPYMENKITGQVVIKIINGN